MPHLLAAPARLCGPCAVRLLLAARCPFQLATTIDLKSVIDLGFRRLSLPNTQNRNLVNTTTLSHLATDKLFAPFPHHTNHIQTYRDRNRFVLTLRSTAPHPLSSSPPATTHLPSPSADPILHLPGPTASSSPPRIVSIQIAQAGRARRPVGRACSWPARPLAASGEPSQPPELDLTGTSNRAHPGHQGQSARWFALQNFLHH